MLYKKEKEHEFMVESLSSGIQQLGGPNAEKPPTAIVDKPPRCR